jgi:hypothetical protein
MRRLISRISSGASSMDRAGVWCEPTRARWRSAGFGAALAVAGALARQTGEPVMAVDEVVAPVRGGMKAVERIEKGGHVRK